MYRKLIILLVIMTVALCADVERRCGPHEVWRECGSACPPTCEPHKSACIQVCVRGCQCKRGFVRHNGKCIPMGQCK